MTTTTRVLGVAVPVADQDAALKFYPEVLRCELRTDVMVWPGARMIEAVLPGLACFPGAAAAWQLDPGRDPVGHL